jgi:hypothetical protein
MCSFLSTAAVLQSKIAPAHNNSKNATTDNRRAWDKEELNYRGVAQRLASRGCENHRCCRRGVIGIASRGRSLRRQVKLNEDDEVAGDGARYRVNCLHVQIEEAARGEVQMMVEQLQRQVIAHVVEMVLVHHVGDLVQLHARLLRVNLRTPADVDDNDALVCGVENGRYRQPDVVGRSEQHRNELNSNS